MEVLKVVYKDRVRFRVRVGNFLLGILMVFLVIIGFIFF